MFKHSIGNKAKCATAIALLSFLAIFSKGCGLGQGMPPQKSPDRNFTLDTSVNESADPRRYLCVIVDIKDCVGKTVCHKVTSASDTQGRAIRWLSKNKIELASSDIGTHHIRRQSDGSWTDDFPEEQ